VRKFLLIRKVPGKRFWQLAFIRFLICMAIILTSLFALGTYHIYFDRTNLPALEPLTRFEFATIGHIYDVNGLPLMEMAREYRLNIPYRDIPPVVRDVILAAEGKNFFTHNGVDYSVIPRVLSKIRFRTLAARLTALSREDAVKSEAIFPHGGSTITQQLVRCHFLKDLTIFQNMTTRENSDQLLHGEYLPRALSYLIGSHSVNMLVRKLGEIRLSSTYGPHGITIAVRIGFDDNRSLGRKETGGRVALPVFRKIMLGVYRKMLAGPVPRFPEMMEESINNYLTGNSPEDVSTTTEKSIPQNIEAPPNIEAKRIISNATVAFFH
jgi:membrane carboxypeptidase/penicillin-binding protein